MSGSLKGSNFLNTYYKMHAFIYTYISTKFINYFNRNWNYIFESLEKFKATSNLKRVYDLKFRKYYTHTHTLSLSLTHISEQDKHEKVQSIILHYQFCLKV